MIHGSYKNLKIQEQGSYRDELKILNFKPNYNDLARIQSQLFSILFYLYEHKFSLRLD